MKFRSRNYTGFTLIELLVVIAIIAILIAIVFPVFAKGRETAKQTQCANQMKQLAAAMKAYTEDYDSTFPPATNFGVPQNQFGRMWPQLLKRYMKTMDICVCPAALGSKFSDKWEDRGMFSIGYNSLTGVDPAGREAPIRACRFSDIEKPSQTPMFADTPFGPTASKYRGYVFDPLNTPSSQLNQVEYRYNTPLCADVDLVAGSSNPPGKLKPIIARHLSDGNGNGVCNIVMADGSVKGYSARQILQQDKGPALHWRFRDLRGR